MIGGEQPLRSEDGLVVDQPSGTRQVSLEVDAEESVELGPRQTVDLGRDNGQRRDVLGIDVGPVSQK